MSKDEDNSEKIIIKGVTTEGERFRPGDWAERMSGSLSTFRNRRIIYSPLLCPAVKNGDKCIVMDKKLKETHPSLYKQMLEFADANQLAVEKDKDNEDS